MLDGKTGGLGWGLSDTAQSIGCPKKNGGGVWSDGGTKKNENYMLSAISRGMQLSVETKTKNELLCVHIETKRGAIFA